MLDEQLGRFGVAERGGNHQRASVATPTASRVRRVLRRRTITFWLVVRQVAQAVADVEPVAVHEGVSMVKPT